MNIDQLETEVNNALFEADFVRYQDAINQILIVFEADKTRHSARLVDFMQEVLDNKHTTYVPGRLDPHQKSKILMFVEHHWNASLPKMTANEGKTIQLDSMVTHLLDILSLLAPMEGKVKKILQEFLYKEEDLGYKSWISLRLDHLRTCPIL